MNKRKTYALIEQIQFKSSSFILNSKYELKKPSKTTFAFIATQ